MTAADTRVDLVPLRTGFDLVWRGFDRDQVQFYVHNIESELRMVADDRDAAVARAEHLARQLDSARTENDELRRRIDRICRTPIDPDALTERLRRMVELAHEEATEITARAHSAAGRSWDTADQAAQRLRQRAEQLVSELDHRRQEMETEHRQLMERARAEVDVTSRQAEQRRRELDEQAARLREQVEDDFRVAMAARRAEAMRALAEQDRAAKAQADRTIRDATAHAERILGDAQRQVDLLRAHRDRLIEELRAAHKLLAEAEQALVPLPGETAVPAGC